MNEPADFEIQDTSALTDADWVEINKLQNAYEDGGQKSLAAALNQLAKDPIRYAVVIGAFYPNMVRETIRDHMAEAGLSEEDLRELIRKLGGASDRKH